MAKIYTKTGDAGMTSLVDGRRVSKADLRLDAYGTVDELNSSLGLARARMKQTSPILSQELDLILKKIQNQLFNVGSQLAAPTLALRLSLPQVENKDILEFEEKIDAMSESLPTLQQFILPGGSENAALAHLNRTICRRAERLVVALHTDTQDLQIVLIYLNRLSDFFFVLARYCNIKEGIAEHVWQK